MEETQNNNNQREDDSWSLYLYAMKSPVTREKYTKRLDKFFDSLGLEGKTIEEKSIKFVHLAKEKGNGWAFNAILKFMQFQLDRATIRKEIVGSTVQNYLKSTILFCEMASIFTLVSHLNDFLIFNVNLVQVEIFGLQNEKIG